VSELFQPASPNATTFYTFVSSATVFTMIEPIVTSAVAPATDAEHDFAVYKAAGEDFSFLKYLRAPVILYA